MGCGSSTAVRVVEVRTASGTKSSLMFKTPPRKPSTMSDTSIWPQELPLETIKRRWGTVTIDTANGANAAKFDADKHNVILVFGGPGTYKGKLMSFLVNTQGFELISMEQMLLEQASLLMDTEEIADDAECGSYTKKVIQHISRTSTSSLLGITLRKIITKVQRQSGHRVLVDLVPNHIPMGLSPLFQSAGKQLARMIEEIECGLAIHIIGSPDPLTFVPKSKRAVKDEADPNLRDRRSTMVKTVAEPLVRAFGVSKQLVTVTVSNPVADENVNHEIEQLLFELNYRQTTSPRARVVFAASADPSVTTKVSTDASGQISRDTLINVDLSDIVDELTFAAPQLAAARTHTRIELSHGLLNARQSLTGGERNTAGCVFIESEAKDSQPTTYSASHVRINLSNDIDLYMELVLGKLVHGTLARMFQHRARTSVIR